MTITETSDHAMAIRALSEQDVFGALGLDNISAIARQSRVERFAPSEKLIAQRDVGDFAYLVLEGRVTVEVTRGADHVVVAAIEPGGLVGEIGALTDTPRTADVVAQQPVSALRIEQATIRELLARDPGAGMRIVAEMGQRLQAVNRAIAILTQATSALADGEFQAEMLDDLRNQATRFSHFADTFTRMATEIAEKRIAGQEMRAAAEIQRSFLPGAIVPGAGDARYEIAAQMLPAKEVGGDFYDYFLIDENTLGFAIGDVSGKGIPAAMFMAVSRTVMKTIALDGLSARDVLSRTNDRLAEDNTEGMFVTVAFGRLDLTTGSVDLSLGAHEEVYILRAGGDLEKLDPMGPALGLFPGADFASRNVTLAPGDTVVFATDGATEAFNDQRDMLGNGAFEVMIKSQEGQGPAQTLPALLDGVAKFADGYPQSDDLTCLVLRYLGTA